MFSWHLGLKLWFDVMAKNLTILAIWKAATPS